MKAMPKLIDQTRHPLERALLRAGREEQPLPGALDRAAHAFGFEASSVPLDATPRPAPHGNHSGLPGAAAGIPSATLRWIALGVVGAASLVGVVSWVRSERGAPASFDRSASIVDVDARPAADPVPPPVAPAPPILPPIDTAPHETNRRPHAHDRAATESAPRYSIADELRLIERARTALREGRAEESLAVLDDHDSKFVPGSFAVESAVIRIDALESLGRAAMALRLADALLSAHPNDTLAPHVRSVVEQIRNKSRQP